MAIVEGSKEDISGEYPPPPELLPTQRNKAAIACPKRSDSGELKARTGESERKNAVRPFFPRLFCVLFSAPLPYSSNLSPLSERLQQANAATTTMATNASLESRPMNSRSFIKLHYD